MTTESERYARVHEVFREVYGVAPVERAGRLDVLCGSDLDLRAEVESLLTADEDSGQLAESELAAARQAVDAAIDGPLESGDDGLGANPWLPEFIGAYRIEKRIGQGGMGVVYEALQESPRRRVAIKLLRPTEATSERAKRFRQEAELLGRLQHPGIAQILEAGTFDLGHGEQPFFAMELVEGVDLRLYADRERLDVRGKLALLAKVADAVHHAHERGVVHRDLKPDNVLVDERGQPKVLDFGIARAQETSEVLSTLVTREGVLMGTLAYMAPEQLEASAITARTDVYALGVLAYELLTGRLPHEIGGLELPAALHVLEKQPTVALRVLAPELRGDVDTIVTKALTRESGKRYATAAAFAADLRRHLDNLPIEARPPSRLYRFRKYARRNRSVVAVLAVVVVAALLSTVLWVREAEQREIAEVNTAKARRGQREAVRTLLGAVQDRLESDDLAGAALLYTRIDPDQRDWASEFLARALPPLLPGSATIRGVRWLDDDHLVDVRADGGLAVRSRETMQVVRRMLDGWSLRSGLVRPGNAFLSRGEGFNDVFLLNLQRGEVEQKLQFPASLPEPRLVIDPDGRAIAAFVDSAERRCVIFVDGVQTLSIPLPEHGDALVWPSPDGNHVALQVGSRMRIHELDSGEHIGSVEGILDLSSTRRAVYSPDGRHLYAQGPRRELVVIDVARAERVGVRPEIVWNHMSLSSDGKLLVSTNGSQVDVWDSQSFERLFRERVDFEGSVLKASFSPNSKFLLVSALEVAGCVIDWREGTTDPEVLGTDRDTRLLTYREHDGSVLHVAASPDGRLAASVALKDPWLRVWDLGSGQTVARMKRGLAPDYGPATTGYIAFSADGERLVLTTEMPDSLGVEVVSWNLATGELERTRASGDDPPNDHRDYIEPFLEALGPETHGRLGRTAFRPAGGEAVIGFCYEPDEPRGKGWRSLCPTPANCWSVTFAPDGSRMAAAVDRYTYLYDATDGTQLGRALSHNYSIDYSPGGKLIAGGFYDGKVRLLDGEYAFPVLEFQAHRGQIDSVAWSRVGPRLLTASMDGTVRVWDARTAWARRADRASYEARLAALRDLEDDELARALDASKEVDVRGAVVRTLLERQAKAEESTVLADEDLLLTYKGHASYVYHVAIHPDGRTVASVSVPERHVHVWDLVSGETLLRLERYRSPGDRHSGWNSLMAFSPDGKRLLLTTEMSGETQPRVVSWNLATGEARICEGGALDGATGHEALVSTFVSALGAGPAMRLGRMAHLSPSGEALLAFRDPPSAASGANWRHCGDDIREKTVGLFGKRGRNLRGFSVSPDGSLFALGGAGYVDLLDAASGDRVERFAVLAYCSAFSPDGSRLAIGGEDGRIHLFDVATLERVRTFQAHEDYVFSLAWSPLGPRLISASGDRTVRVWRVPR